MYRLSYFDGGSRSQAPTLSVATDLQMHCSVHGTLKAPIRSQLSVRGDTSLRWLWSIKMAQVENKLRKLKRVVGFPGSSAGKKVHCKAGEPGSMPESGRSPGEGIGYPFSGFPGGSDGEESGHNVGDLGFIPGLRRSPWRRAWQPPPVFLPGKSHGQRSLGATVRHD